MGIGREVADAYISVHGDLTPFRRDLNDANADMRKEAQKAADEFSKEWGKRMARDMNNEWMSVIDGLYSGTKMDMSKMFDTFDSSDLDAASEKIHSLIGEMQDLGKISDEDATKALGNIDREVKARQAAFFAQKDHADQQRGWDEAHRQMMEQLAAIRKNDTDQALSDFSRMQSAQDNYNKSFEAMFRANRMADMTSDFAKMVRAVNDMDWTKFASGFQDLDGMRDRIAEVNSEMLSMGRISEDNAKRMQDDVAAWIAAEEERRRAVILSEEQIATARKAASDAAAAERVRQSQANRQALDEAKRLLDEQEKYNRSFEGLQKIAAVRQLEGDFRNLTEAMRSNDWSQVSRGVKNIREMRVHVQNVATQMRDMGRVTTEEFGRITREVDRASIHQRDYNISFDEGTRKINNFRGAITKAHGVFAKMFTLTKGFREHLGGFAGINVFGDLLQEGLDFIHNLDRIALNAGITATKLATMASIGGGAMLSMVTIAGDLMAILGGLAAIAPSFLVGAGIGIGVLIAAFKDMKTVLKDLGPMFGKLQDSISAAFWKKAEGPIRSLVQTMMPLISAKTAGTATALGTVFASLADALKGIPTATIGTMFDRMNSAITILAGAMSPLIKAFTTLGEVGSQYFERFATWLVELSTRFNNFIQAAAADGRLNGWIDEMIVQFANLGRAIDGIFGIFNALDQAASAAGFGGLKTFADNLQGMAKAMQSTGAQTAMTQLFSGMLILVTKVGEALGNLGTPLASIMPTINLALSAIGGAVAQVIGYIGQIMADPAVQQGITDFTNGIALAVAALAPAVGPFAASLGNVMGLLGLILVNVAKIVSAFTVQLGPVLDQMSKQFETLVAPLGDAVLNLITAITPVAQAINDNLVGPIVSGIRDQIIPGFNTMVTTLAPIAAQMVAALGPVLQALLPLIPPIMQLATTIGTVLGQAIIAVAPFFVVLVNAITPIVNAIVQLVNMIAPFLVPAISAIAAAVSPVVAVLGQVASFILSILVPILGVLLIGVINNVVGVFQGLSGIFMGVVNIITAIFVGFGTFFTKLFQGDIGGAMDALGKMFGDIWNGIVQLIGGVLQTLWNGVQLLFIGKLVGGIRSALTSMSGFFSSIWNSIVGFVKGALGNINGTVTSILGSVKGFIQGALNGMLGFFKTAWTNIGTAVSGGVNTVMGFVRGLPGQIGNALSGLGNLLVGAGKAILDGLLAGLKEAWGGVTSFVGGIADWIAKNKGPLPYDRQLLVPAGKAIMEGLGAGLEGQMSNLLSTLQAITAGITNAVTDAFAHSKMYLAGADAALGLADGLSANKAKVAAALGSLTPDASLSANISGTASGGVGTPTPVVQKVINVAEGAINISTPTKSPELVAAKTIDELVINSNF